MVTVLHHTETGGHAHNEDAFAVGPHPNDPDCWLCALADSQGGQSGGGPAARLASRTVFESAAVWPPDQLLTADAWVSLCQVADEAVRRDPEAGLTTLVAFCVRNGVVCGASCGDSAAVAVGSGRPGVLLTEHQFKNPPVGSGGAPFVPFEAELVRPWEVLALSDGVWKYAGWEAVLAAARLPPEEALADLRGRVAFPGSGRVPDDFTLVVLRG
jgi:hypothetical protein